MREPAEFERHLAALGDNKRTVRLDQATAADALARLVTGHGGKVARGADPIALMKAVKNPVEIAGARAAQARDGAAVVRFLAWFDREAPKGDLTEIEAVKALESFRRDSGLLKDVSFPTISGAGPDGAIVHYRVTAKTNRKIVPGELFLVDSGGQYEDGTTDITRTIAVGEPSAEMRDRFTRVLKGHIAIARAIFPDGTTGAQLDSFARQFLWQAGLDFDHGTGHGVGSYLSVHEGPARISKLGSTPLKRGMILSNEPGYYKTGAYGIRIENLVLVVEATPPVAGAEKPLNAFETITLAPIDLRLVARELMSAEETLWLDRYHAQVPQRSPRWWMPKPAPGSPPQPGRQVGIETPGHPLSSPVNDRMGGEPRRTPLSLIALLVAMSGIGSASLNILVPAIPGLVAKFATDAASVQLTISLYLMGLAVAQLVFGPLSDRFGRRPVLIAGLAIATLASTAAIFVGDHQRARRCARRAIARRFDRADHQPRDHPRSLRARTCRLDDRARHVSGRADADDGAPRRWHPRHAVRLGVDLRFCRIFTGAVFLWALLALPETRKFSTAPGGNGRLLPDLKALASSPKFFGYALCAGLGSAPFFSFLGGAPHVTVTMLGRTSAEYGLWFFLPSFGFMTGNFIVSRLSGRFTIDQLIWAGIAATIIGCLISIVTYVVFPGWEMVTIFLPQIIVGIGNGLLLPTSVAGAVSIRPHVAGTASGLTGFIQMAIGAFAAQISGHVIGHASSAMPMLLLMLGFGIATGVAVFALVRRT